MVSARREITVGLAAVAVLALGAAPATAATTTIRAGTAAAAPYSGSVQVSLLGTGSVATIYGTGTCNQVGLTASVQSNGTALGISAASFSNTPGPACPVTGSTATVTVTPQSLPWSGGNVTYAPVAGGRDATITITNFKTKVVTTSVPVLGTVTCVFGGSLTADGFNPTNANRPDTSVAQAQGKLAGATISKIAAGSDVYCPPTATVTANFKLVGKGSTGTYNQALFVTS